MKKPILVVMAAGMGSRYGGLKQIDPVGCEGEAILDYSLFDAHEAGFDTAVIIIKEAIKKDFMETVGARLEKAPLEIRYAYQELDKLPAGYTVPEGRTKPWGTCHAVVCAREAIGDAPFAVINADDYYGKEAFVRLHDFLQGYTPDKPGDLAMAGFVLKNTLSDNGAVTRGICQMNDAHYLTGVLETSGIEKTANGAAAGGKDIDINSLVSMNMWAGYPDFLQYIKEGFPAFLEQLGEHPEKKEYLLPNIVAELLEKEATSVKVLSTSDKWIGITYKEDIEPAQESFSRMITAGCYPENLWI